MFYKKCCIYISVFLALLVQPFLKSFLFAQQIPAYEIQEIVSGNISDIQVQAFCTEEISNLGIFLRVSSSRTDSFDIIIPAGTLFSGLSSGNENSVYENDQGVQSFLNVMGNRSRFPGGGRPELDQKGNLSSFESDILLYALCYNVELDVPIPGSIYNPQVENLESIPRIAKMIQGFEKFDVKMQQIDAKIRANQTLTDEETRYAAFIDWQEEAGPFNQTTFLKSGVQRKNKQVKLIPYKKFGLTSDQLETYPPEIRRETAQNVVWTMSPEDQDFSPEGVRDEISAALHIYDSDSLDNFIRPANSLLELLELDRRLLVVDSLRYLNSHFIDYPPYYITWWDGAGAGWASRMSLPYEKKYSGCKWQILDIRYYLQADNAGSFQAAILDNSNGSPGNDLMSPKTASFSELPYGDFVTVDVSSENIIVDGDFFIALFQTDASNPAVFLSEAINGRAFGFNGVNWSSQDMTLFFQATLELVNSVPAAPVLIAPAADPIQADQARFVWTKAEDPDVGNVVTYQLQFALQNNFTQLLHSETNLLDTTFVFANLLQQIRDQMNEKVIYWRVQAQDNFGGVSQFSSIKSFRLQGGIITNSNLERKNLPGSFALYPNYPNPFNPYTVIKFDVPVLANISIKIFNSLGQMVKTLVDQQVAPGYQQVTWDGSDQNGIILSSGIYFIQMKTSDYQKVQKITFLR